jgi:hypothetical protein
MEQEIKAINMNTNRTYDDRESGASGKLGWRVLAARSPLWLGLMMAWVSGCSTIKESLPPRTATEELLLSSAADRALEYTSFPWLDGKKVFVEDKYFESYDKGHAVSLLRERLSASGALFVKTDDKADVIVELRSDALSMDMAEMLVGLPAMALPIPLAGPVTTPEIVLYKSHRSDAVTKVALFAYERASGRYLESSGPMLGRAYLHLYKVLVVSWRRTDVPELPGHGNKKKGPSQPPRAGAAAGPQPERPGAKTEAPEASGTAETTTGTNASKVPGARWSD